MASVAIPQFPDGYTEAFGRPQPVVVQRILAEPAAELARRKTTKIQQAAFSGLMACAGGVLLATLKVSALPFTLIALATLIAAIVACRFAVQARSLRLEAQNLRPRDVLFAVTYSPEFLDEFEEQQKPHKHSLANEKGPDLRPRLLQAALSQTNHAMSHGLTIRLQGRTFGGTHHPAEAERLHANLRRAGLSESDLFAILSLANGIFFAPMQAYLERAVPPRHAQSAAGPQILDISVFNGQATITTVMAPQAVQGEARKALGQLGPITLTYDIASCQMVALKS